ncbi:MULTISPECIES: hypothetical protein [Streptomyces]|uniref:Uncharacterized protein n=2 Tax=Streptomyces TaxID=1883 RepID=A0A100Y4X5_9ACTN|nr:MULTISPECIES: hypothetical protein [Streptomyces]KUH37756.1 hypothetical protein ATE80_16575 [Streptomyces kanasensis]UUS34365.1 hypothetical protein NRO40_28395 [Streptomyces changanensis]
MYFEQVFTYAWRDGPAGRQPSVLSVAHEPDPTAPDGGRRWILLAGTPDFSETLAFDGAEHVREFARAVLDLPPEPAPYERRLLFSETVRRTLPSGPTEETRYATLWVGRDPEEELRGFFSYQSYYSLSGGIGGTGGTGMTALGLEVVCDDVDVSRARAGARELLAELEGPADSPDHAA